MLLANILLLILICFFVVKAVNGRASEIAAVRMTKTCQHIVTQMNAQNMTLADAANYASQQGTVGDYSPTVKVFNGAEGVILETNDPSIMVNILEKKETEFARVNCSKLARN